MLVEKAAAVRRWGQYIEYELGINLGNTLIPCHLSVLNKLLISGW